MENKKSFFSTKEGKLVIAGIIIFLAFPIYFIGAAAGIGALNYLCFFLIVGGMCYSPIDVYLLHRKE